MYKRMYGLKLLLFVALFVSVLSGCTKSSDMPVSTTTNTSPSTTTSTGVTVNDPVPVDSSTSNEPVEPTQASTNSFDLSMYPIVSATIDGNRQSTVYLASNETVPELAEKIRSAQEPLEISNNDEEQMFLVYDNEWYHLQKEPNNAADTLIEVSSNEFVQENYDTDFVKGYVAATFVQKFFHSSGKKKAKGGTYKGYVTMTSNESAPANVKSSSVKKNQKPPTTTKGTGSITKRASTSNTVQPKIDEPDEQDEWNNSDEWDDTDDSDEPVSTSKGKATTTSSKKSASKSKANTAKITKSSSDSSTSSSSSSSSSSFKPSRTQAPSTSSGTGKVTRRR